MSYSIIFETKIVLLSDGRILHFCRSGCNNDNAGRRKDDFTASIHTKEDFLTIIEGYKSHSLPYSKSEPGNWDMKIGSRYATYYDYGEHLMRMYKRALPYKEFITQYGFYCTLCTGVQLYEPEEKIISLKEFNDNYYELLNRTGRLAYRHLKEYPDIKNEALIIQLIEDKKPINFEILKHKKFNLGG